MNNRQRALAVLNYENYDRLPIVHFGYWQETLEKWVTEGHLTEENLVGVKDGSPAQNLISQKLGFDINWHNTYLPNIGIFPPFEKIILEESPEGIKKIRNPAGVTVMIREGAVSIPSEVDHLLKDRKSWEEYYLPRLQWSPERIRFEVIEQIKKDIDRENHLGLHCGSLFGFIRDLMGVVEISYLLVDDEKLYDEIIETVGNLCYKSVETILATGVKFDFAHFWEDICFKNGPLVVPSVFHEKVGPYYKRITDLTKSYGIDIVSLDCDGCIDSLIPTWLENGVNTMFPIEVGTWNASIKPWREKYGKNIRGVGGMNKNAFAYDYATINAEIERLKPLVELGGYIPCPDHRIPPDAKWENIQYYCDRMRKIFG